MGKKKEWYRIGIDMGERHLFAIVSDRPDMVPVLVPNTMTPQKMASVRNGERQGDIPLHGLRTHIESRCSYLLGLCAKWGVRTIAIGNRAIKNPFKITSASLAGNPLLSLNLQILGALRFECALSGIDVEIVDEAYTSQADALVLEKLRPVQHGERRPKGAGGLRGRMYRSRNGETMDRDINAAINIGRLVFGDEFALPVIQSKLWKNPVRERFPEENRPTSFVTLRRQGAPERLLFSSSAVEEMPSISVCLN